jgi:hypothetical protein
MPGLLTYVQCSHFQDLRGTSLELLPEDRDTKSAVSDSPVKKSSEVDEESSSDPRLRWCLLKFLDAFLDGGWLELLLRWRPEARLVLPPVFLDRLDLLLLLLGDDPDCC